MKITVLEKGKWDSFKCQNEDGTISYYKPGKFVRTPIVEGNTYEVETWQGEGSKTVYLNKVKPVAGITGAIPSKKYDDTSRISSTKSNVSRVQAVDTTSYKMSKADWEKKDHGIKWLTCLKAAAELHSRRSESGVKNVIDDAIKLYYAEPVVTETAKEDVFDLNSLKEE